MPDMSRQFHGARVGINDTHIRPPSQTGVYAASSKGFSGGTNGYSHEDVAFSTKSEHSAWNYARAVPTSPNAPANNDPDPKHRGRVYTVEPAKDQHVESEISSPTGFKITGSHDSPTGAMATFPSVNWNAYKAKNGGQVSHVDKNQSYMDTSLEPERKPHVPLPVQEGKDNYSNKNRVDDRHPDQLNLFSGRTVQEHNDYNNTSGTTMHLSPGQFKDTDDFHKDPTTSVIRARQDYADMDSKLGKTR
jgi:hypothetical protein